MRARLTNDLLQELGDLHNLAITAEALTQKLEQHGVDIRAADCRAALDQAHDNAAPIVTSLGRLR